MPLLAIAIVIICYYLFFQKDDDPRNYKGDSYETYKKYCVPKTEKIYIVTEGDFKNSVLPESEVAEIKATLKSEYEKFIQEMATLKDEGKITEQEYNHFVDSALDDMLKQNNP